MGNPIKKIDQLRAIAASGDWEKTIKFAAKFPRLGKHRNAILDAKEAIIRPDFLRQINRDPGALISAGKIALVEKYKL